MHNKDNKTPVNGWKTLSSRIAYQNPFMRVHEDQAINPAGAQTIYGYCESTEASAYIIPVDDAGNTFLVQQYRYPLQKIYWEIVAGRMPHSEDISEGARRELLEETGLHAGEMTAIGKLFTAPGIANFPSTVFLARKLHKRSDELDAADGITGLKKLSFEAVDAMILSGEIQCATGIAAYTLAKAYLNKEAVKK